MRNPEPKGHKVARRFAQWHLGDPSWADSILHAYLNPDVASESLDQEMRGYDEDG